VPDEHERIGDVLPPVHHVLGIVVDAGVGFV
jgi:hypothetical protein